MRTLPLALLVAAAVTTRIAAQTPAPPETQDPLEGPTFRTGIELIAVDVAVVDPDGRPVEDLRAPEFSVKVDGQQRRVVSAELVKVDAEAARREAQDATESFYSSNLVPPNARMVVIAVDQTNIGPAAIKPLMGAASRFLDQLSPLDEVAFVAYPEPGPRVAFTRDRLRVRLAMERLIGRTEPPAATHLNIGVAEAMAIETRRDSVVLAQVVARECRAPNAARRTQCENDIRTQSTRIAARVREDADHSLQGLRQLLRRLALVEGAKSLILISEGLAVDDPRELDEIAVMAGRARVSISVMLVDLGRGDVTIREAPPTETQDRRIQMRGLELLATMARGSLYYIVGTGEQIFDRLASEISAYYLLGIEQQPGDDRAERRRIDVEVRRRDVTIRSRQAFVLSPAVPASRQTPDERLQDALQSPFGVSGVPLRVTTFAQQEPGTDRVQLTIAAQVGAAGATPGTYTVGYVLVDDRNRVAASFIDERTLSPLADSSSEPLSFVGGATVDSGVYTLRFGVVDAEGRAGSVVRDVNAWKLAGEEFAIGDLILGNMPAPGEGLRPSVEPHVTADALGMYVELYSTSAETWDDASIVFEIAEEEHSDALATASGRLAPGREPTWRAGSGIMSAQALPPGAYVARARVARGGTAVGLVARPFVIEREDRPRRIAPVTTAAAAVSFATTLPAFDRSAVLAPELLSAMLDIAEQRAPMLKTVIAQARAGSYGTAALDALSEGDQTIAAFLRGLDLFVKGELDGAAAQLDIASGPTREFFPAALYLGAAFAQVGRDREAAGIWQLALGDEPRPAAAYLMLADARLRDGQAVSAIDVLAPAYARMPENEEIAKRLGMAYVMTGRYREAIPVLDRYLASHPAEQDLLLAAVIAHYEARRAGPSLSGADREKLRRYASAYGGPHQALVQKYLATLGVP